MLPFELTKGTPYLALSGELWSVFYEYFNRNWPCYKGFLLYMRSLRGYLYDCDSEDESFDIAKVDISLMEISKHDSTQATGEFPAQRPRTWVSMQCWAVGNGLILSLV